MKDYLTTHTFKSAEMKKKMQETLGSMSPADIIKSTTGPNAVCQSSFVSCLCPDCSIILAFSGSCINFCIVSAAGVST